MMSFLKFGFLIIVFALSIELLFANLPYNAQKGEQLYMEQCSKCHRKGGSGVKDVYPPLKNSDYVKNGDNVELLRGMLYGRSGKITVNSITYQGVMTTEIDKSLTDDDITFILTYVFQKLNGINKTVNIQELKTARKAGKLPVHK